MHRADGLVVVITGASSGLGRETALQLAARGCRLVLAARRVTALRETATQCRARGAEAVLAVPTDVTREEDVEALAQAALKRWNRIDVWVNNAGVTLFGKLEEAPLAAHRQVIETNLFGSIHGARAVVPVFRRQRSGILVNVGSILSKIGQAYVPSYVISKFALRGLSEALRAELADEPDIHVCTVLPYAIDTPHFQSGANALGLAAHAMPPVQSPEAVAREILALIDRPRRERHVPRYARLGLALHELAPRTVELLLLRALNRFHLRGSDAIGDGNIFAADSEPGAVHGERGPVVSVPRFFAWCARELVQMQVQGVRERLTRWRLRPTTP